MQTLYLGTGYSSCNSRFRAVDNVGNASEWTSDVHIHMDTELAAHTNWWWGEVTKDVARLYIQATDNASGIARVTAPTSTQSGGYGNWVWFEAVWDAGANAYRADITPATFGHYGETYLTHLYIYDNAGNGGYYNQTTVNIPVLYEPREIGDEVRVGGEYFYVLEWDNNKDTVDLIASNNINSVGTEQTSNLVAIQFSSTRYWKDSFTSSPFNLNNITGYKSTDVMGLVRSYGSSKGAVSSRLLTYEEAIVLQTKSSSNAKIKQMYASGRGYGSWLGSARDFTTVWVVNERTNEITWGTNLNTGQVRPVITVLKSSIY